VLQLASHEKMEHDCCQDQNALHNSRPSRDDTIASVEVKESQEANLPQIDTDHELLQGTCVKPTFRVDPSVTHLQHVVPV